jgi:hypothetical protein
MSQSKTIQAYLVTQLPIASLKLLTILTLVFFLIKAPSDPVDIYLSPGRTSYTPPARRI